MSIGDIWDHNQGQPPEETNYCEFCGRSSERVELEETNEGFYCYKCLGKMISNAIPNKYQKTK